MLFLPDHQNHLSMYYQTQVCVCNHMYNFLPLTSEYLLMINEDSYEKGSEEDERGGVWRERRRDEGYGKPDAS